MTTDVMRDRQLADACLKHLTQEESLLVAAREALEKVRGAIARGGPKDLAEALQHQAGVFQAGTVVRDGRQALRQSLATALALPVEECTLQLLTAQLPPDEAEQMSQTRQRLRQLAAEVDRLNHGIAVVSHYQLDFLQHLFGEITGAGQHGGCYGPEGQRRDPVCGSLIELRG